MLLQQFIAPFLVHPNVDITLQWQAYTITVSGIPDAVTNAHNYISNQVDKYLYVEDTVLKPYRFFTLHVLWIIKLASLHGTYNHPYEKHAEMPLQNPCSD